MPHGIMIAMDIKQDILAFLEATGWNASQLAHAAKISQPVISRLLTDGASRRHGCHSSTLQKLFPFLYGDRRPTTPDPTTPAAPPCACCGESGTRREGGTLVCDCGARVAGAPVISTAEPREQRP